MNKNAGFTLIEVVAGALILSVALLSTLSLLSHSINLPQANQNSILAIHQAEKKLEEICVDDYLTIAQQYTNRASGHYYLKETPFSITGLNGMGCVYAEQLPKISGGVEIRPSDEQLIRMKVVVCYREKNRIIGEDANLNGVLDAGEDDNENGELDSPAHIETVIVQKEL